MKSELWQEDQPVLRDDLILAQSSKEEAISERLLDTFRYGVVRDSQLLLELIPFEITVNTLPFSADIGTGVAYDPSGERVAVSSLAAYNAAAPATVTDNGIGGTSLTPQSTGSIAVPLTSGQVNYIYVSYLQTIDPDVFSLQSTTNQRLFTKGADGYLVEVVVDPGPLVGDPDLFKPNPDAVFLGVVDISQVLNMALRPTYNLKQNNLLATVPNPLDTLDALGQPYTADQQVSHDQHIRAVGTGLVTPVNPHGLAVSDLTGSFTGKTSELHEKLFHESGISGVQTSLVSGLYGFSVDSAGAPIAPTFARDNFIIKKLLVTEAVQVNGITISSTDLSEDFLFYFLDSSGNFLDNGTYTIYLDSLTKTLKLAANGSPTNTAYRVYGVTSGTFTNLNTLPIATVTAAASNFLLWEVQWDSTGSGLGNDNFITIVDKRIFGTIGNNSLARDIETDTITLSHNLRAQSVSTRTVGGAPAVIVKDSATGLIDEVFLDETGIQFPTGNKQIDSADIRHYASFTVTADSFTPSFTVTAGAFTPVLSGAIVNVPAIEIFCTALSISQANTGTSDSGYDQQPGTPFNSPATNPHKGIYLTVPIGSVINAKVNFNNATGSGSATFLVVAITKF